MGLEATSVGSYVGGYKLQRYLGEGRLGPAFRATHQTPEIAHEQGGDVCLRALRPELCAREDFRERFTANLAGVVRLDHPGIVRHIDALELPDGQLCLVEEFVDAGTMAELLGRGTAMPWSRALTFVHPVLAALAHAQARDVVHGAISAKNVIIRRQDEQIMLADFGVGAMELGPGLESMAPELMRQGGAALLVAARPAFAATERSDVYSVGMLLYLALTGSYPWGTSKEPRAIIEAKRQGRFPRADTLNPALPPALAAVVAGALELDPATRIGSLTELARALTQATEPALGHWVKPGKTITREKQFVAQRLEQALERREAAAAQGSLPKLKAVDLRAPSSRTLKAIHVGDVDPQEIARIERTREAWASRERRATAKSWARVAAGVLGPLLVVVMGLAMVAGVPIPVPADWMIFVLPSIPFFYVGGILGVLGGLRKLQRDDLSLLAPGLLSPIVATTVLFAGDFVLSFADLGGSADSGPRAGLLLAAIWSISALLGCWYGERLNVRVQQSAVEKRLPPSARQRPITSRHRAVVVPDPPSKT